MQKLHLAGRRVHGTTRQLPLERFDQVERAALLPLPLSPWELAEWKQAKLHADCHVVFDGADYSGPHRLLGERLWVRATAAEVELFRDYALVATHRRGRPGQRRTVTAHLPPHKVHFLMQTPAWCREHAAQIGPACAQFIEALHEDRLHGVVAVLGDDARAGARGFQARGAIPLRESEHALRAAEPIERAIAEQPV